MHVSDIVKGWKCCLVLAVATCSLAPFANGHEPRVKYDVVYARAGATPLLLDLYVPAHAPSPPVVVWVHGGAWRSGSKKNPPLLPLASRGIAVASVDYRLSPVAKFPAQIHDLKAAIRFLRGKSRDFGINSGSDRWQLGRRAPGGGSLV
jgi:acetyl esterase/lipase